MFEKFRQRCPDCGKRLSYWKPVDGRDIDTWYCKRCPNLFKRKGENLSVG